MWQGSRLLAAATAFPVFGRLEGGRNQARVLWAGEAVHKAGCLPSASHCLKLGVGRDPGLSGLHSSSCSS